MADDVMIFPNTWEEFERDFGFVDSKNVYTYGLRLIPSFRVQQWLEHISHKQTSLTRLIEERKQLKELNKLTKEVREGF